MALGSHQEAVPALCQAVRHHHPGKIQTRMGSVLHRQGSVTASTSHRMPGVCVLYLNNWLGEGPQWSFCCDGRDGISVDPLIHNVFWI